MAKEQPQEGFLSWLSETDRTALSPPLPPNELLALLSHLLPPRPKFSRLLARWKSNSPTASKNGEEAEKCKQRGNEAFAKRQWKEAVRLFSMAAQHAPPTSPLLPVSYANRSAALFELSLFQQCLTDINLSLTAGYPSTTRYKLLNRRAQCWAKLGFPTDIIVTEFELAEKEAVDNGAAGFAERIRSGLESFRDASRSGGFGESSERERGSSKQTVEDGSVASPLYIQYNPPERSLHAARNISKGEVLIRERPYACLLRRNFREQRCEYCLRTVDLNPVFCTTCTKVRYCSPTCRDTAQRAYHGHECNQTYLEDLEDVDVLTLRVYWLGQEGSVDGLCASDSEIHARDLSGEVPGCDEEGRYVVSHTTILTLLDHISSHPHSTLLHQSILFTLLSQHLALPPKAASELLHIWAKIRCNSFTIKGGVAVDAGAGRVQSVEEEVLGVGVFGRGSLVNHSCDPNSIVSFEDGAGMVLRSLRSLGKGEEVTISYGPLKSRMGREDRRRKLREGWFFECLCEACSASDTIDIATSHRCVDSYCLEHIAPTQMVCPKCGSSIDVEARKKRLTESDTLFKNNLHDSNPKSRSILQHVLSIREGILHPHNRTLAQIYDAFAEWYANNGDYSTSAKYCQKAVEIIKVLDGGESVEVAREEFKIAQLLFNGREVQAASLAVERAIKSYERCFGVGKGGEGLEELYAMRDCLNGLR
ncbi:SET and MYND domain-containing protein 4 [Rhizophlyctis rosea]|uniref:Protein-lysine N-methyltransferase SMYD4 n=1 Tax=Rhizophlyctis rosea TaxID=64517 RepID=A0AAD5SHT6_9FUNG|nr:SET and MYND domain-containing protein 4 [Rhizophlyctis rosea]